jgi:hypothetical protein
MLGGLHLGLAHQTPDLTFPIHSKYQTGGVPEHGWCESSVDVLRSAKQGALHAKSTQPPSPKKSLR